MIEMSLSDVVAASAAPAPKAATPVAATPETSGAIITEAQAQATHRPRSSAFFKPPMLNVAQKVGELGDQFTPGSIVFDKMISLGCGAKAGDDVIHMIRLGIRNHYVQHRVYGSEGMPESLPSEEAVLAAGGVLRQDDDDTGDKWFRPAADVILLVRAPKSVPEEALGMFPFQVGGHHWGPAIWYVRATQVSKLIGYGFGRAEMIVGKTPWLATWNVSTFKKTGNGNSWFVPSATFVEKIDPESELGKLASEKAAEMAM